MEVILAVETLEVVATVEEGTEMYHYYLRDGLDERSVFANDVLRLLWQKHKGEWKQMEPELKTLYDHFFENVHNFYELISVDYEVPLFCLYELKTQGKDAFDFDTEEDYVDALRRTLDACLELYS